MKQLSVVVVGAGIGGLYTALALAADGHTVSVLESAPAFEEVGAGIRVPPNSSRLSQAWGVDFSKIKKVSSKGNRFLDWKGNVLLDIPFHDIEQEYGAPYYFLHRADLIKLLVETASSKPNITIRTSARVTSYDFSAPSVTLSSGKHLSADLIVAADGIKSSVRNAINGSPIAPRDTGDVAYRILVPADPLRNDPHFAHLVAQPWANHWLGPEAHAVGYPLRNGELYNIIIDVTHRTDRGQPLKDDEQVWKSARSNAELVERFGDWCPEVKRLCAMTGEYLKWKLADFEQLDHWVHPEGKVVLLGDSCHPMMPYLAQGAAQATEDAAALAAALRKEENVGEALKLYEGARKPRAAYIAKNTRVMQQWLHLYDDARGERDEWMKEDSERNPMFWGWTKRKDWLFGHDARDLSEKGIPSLPPMPPRSSRVYGDGD